MILVKFSIAKYNLNLQVFVFMEEDLDFFLGYEFLLNLLCISERDLGWFAFNISDYSFN